MPLEISDAEILQEHARTVLDGLHTAMPAKVVTYYPETQTADVQPVCKRALFYEDGTRTYEDLPMIPHVPVAFPRGGGYVLAFPLEAGDPVWLVFSEVATGEYQATGDVAEPQDTRRHGLGCPIAIPASFPDPNALTDATAAGAGLVVGIDGDDAQIRIAKATPGPAVVQIGAHASDFAALASKVDAIFQAMATWVVVPNDGGGALKAKLTAAGLNTSYTVAATRTKVQ